VYKKKSETFKVRLVDDTVKTILTDLSVPVSELIEVIGKKVGLKNPLEFSLQEEGGKNAWLKNNLALPEQVKTLDQTFLLKKKFFVNDANVSTDNPVELHLVYCQVTT
jgi:talin